MKECHCELIEAKSKQVAPGKSPAFFKRCGAKYVNQSSLDYFPEGARWYARGGQEKTSQGGAFPIVLRLGCLGVTWVGWSPVAVGVAVALGVASCTVTALYHRYFSHRTFSARRGRGRFPFRDPLAIWPFSAALSGGRRCTGITTGIRTRRRM